MQVVREFPGQDGREQPVHHRLRRGAPSQEAGGRGRGFRGSAVHALPPPRMPDGHHPRHGDRARRRKALRHGVRDRHGEDDHFTRSGAGARRQDRQDHRLPHQDHLAERPGHEGAPFHLQDPRRDGHRHHRPRQVLPPVQGCEGLREHPFQRPLHDVRGRPREEPQGEGRGMQVLRQGAAHPAPDRAVRQDRVPHIGRAGFLLREAPGVPLRGQEGPHERRQGRRRPVRPHPGP